MHSHSGEAGSSSASLEFPHSLCSSKFHFRVHKSPPVFLVLSQTSAVQALQLCLFNISFNVTLPLMAFLFKWTISSFSTKISTFLSPMALLLLLLLLDCDSCSQWMRILKAVLPADEKGNTSAKRLIFLNNVTLCKVYFEKRHIIKVETDHCPLWSLQLPNSVLWLLKWNICYLIGISFCTLAYRGCWWLRRSSRQVSDVLWLI